MVKKLLDNSFMRVEHQGSHVIVMLFVWTQIISSLIPNVICNLHGSWMEVKKFRKLVHTCAQLN